LVPFLPRSVGFLPVFFPPEPGLAQHRVAALPSPLHPAEFVALGDQHRPDLLEDAPLDPALEPVVDRALGAEPLGELAPLAAGPHPEEDAVEHLPPVSDPASGRLGGPELHEDRLDPLPQRVGDLPDRPQRRASRSSSGHRCGSRCEVRYAAIALQLLQAKGVPVVLG
jgi:hypothetical protein